MRTLEIITNDMLKKGVQPPDVSKRLHAASMIAMIEAGHAVLNGSTMATPLFRLKYDEESHNVDFQMLEGYAAVPEENSLDVTMTDLLYASLFRRKLPLLWEGKTGIGKTFTTEQFFKTVLPKENYSMLRLNATMSNVLQPYTEGAIDNGLVRIRLKKEALEQIGAIFIDEVNRGDTNSVLQLQDGVISLSSGERGDLGIPIPTYNAAANNWELDKVNKRPVFVVSAQNPPVTKDAKYTGTRRGDAAQNNRNLQVNVPNSAASIGASSLILNPENHHHDRFRTTYIQRMATHMGMEPEAFGSLDDWISIYAFTTDPRKTACPKIPSSIEFIDAMLVMTAPDLKTTTEQEQKTTVAWNEKLKAYRADFKYTTQLNDSAASVLKVKDIVKSFEEDIIPRDIEKVEKIADAVAMIRRVKDALDAPDPITAYLQSPNYITVKDVACSLAVVLHDKQEDHTTDPVALVDQVLREYTSMAEVFANKRGYKREFALNDPGMSVYQIAFQHAISSMEGTVVGGAMNMLTGATDPHISRFIADLGESVAELRRLDAGNELRKPMVARMIADIATLAGFAHQYKAELEPRLAAQKTPKERRQVFYQFYAEKGQLASTPPIYQHRLKKVLGG